MPKIYTTNKFKDCKGSYDIKQIEYQNKFNSVVHVCQSVFLKCYEIV